ncbi:MAG: hypothetical protein RLZ14_955 [Actinomycetota bacterium]
MTEGYDIIGDIHGHLGPLRDLLHTMGYREVDRTWHHPTRTAVFVGDLVDRGQHQVEVLELAQRMVAAGTARMVIGNHEYNAVAWHTPVVEGGDEFCRPHSEKNHRQHTVFLEKVVEGSPTHQRFLEWFCTLPLWLELELGGARLRVVHACWNEAEMHTLEPLLDPDRSLNLQAVRATSVKHSPAYEALETVLKGPEIDLGGLCYLDKGGIPRRKARRRWWDPTATTLRRAALIPRGALTPDRDPFPELPDTPIDPLGQYDGAAPVVVGHYWEQIPVALYSPKVACVDYSVAGTGPLVAYRWSGEATLDAANYVVQPVRHPHADDNLEPGDD